MWHMNVGKWSCPDIACMHGGLHTQPLYMCLSMYWHDLQVDAIVKPTVQRACCEILACVLLLHVHKLCKQ